MKHENNIKNVPSAEKYEEVVGTLTEIWDKLLIFRIKSELGSVKKSGTMLDVGMGSGIILRNIARDKFFDGFNLIGIDYFEDMVEIAAKKIADEKITHRINAAQGDASHLDFDDNSIDVIISRATIHHLANPTNALKEKYRVLKPGGFAIIHDARRDAPQVTLDHFAEMRKKLGLGPTNISEKFTIAEMKSFISDAGLDKHATIVTSHSGPESIGYELMIYKPSN